MESEMIPFTDLSIIETSRLKKIRSGYLLALASRRGYVYPLVEAISIIEGELLSRKEFFFKEEELVPNEEYFSDEDDLE